MTIQELKLKHDKLKKLDGTSGLFNSPLFNVFGSTTHKYKFNPRLTESTASDFERTHQVKLPNEYRDFILLIGNGGSGPAYGLFQLTDWNFELGSTDKNYLATPFPHTEKWNISKDFNTGNEDYFESEEWENEYFSNAHTTGSLRICHYGCAIYYLLIVSGAETGHIWVDDRANDQGIYPVTSRTSGLHASFFDWYNEWLTESIEQVLARKNRR